MNTVLRFIHLLSASTGLSRHQPLLQPSDSTTTHRVGALGRSADLLGQGAGSWRIGRNWSVLVTVQPEGVVASDPIDPSASGATSPHVFAVGVASKALPPPYGVWVCYCG